MNSDHYHLFINHFPIVLPIIGLLVLFSGYLFKSEVIKRTALGLFIAGALCTLPAFLTGEAAEEVVEHLPGMSHDLIHEHEETSETFALLSYLLGGLALISLWANFTRKRIAGAATLFTLVFSLAVIYFAARTGTSGGEISHPAIRNSAAAEQTNQP